MGALSTILTFPALSSDPPGKLADMLQNVYAKCQTHQHRQEGKLAKSLKCDVKQKYITLVNTQGKEQPLHSVQVDSYEAAGVQVCDHWVFTYPFSQESFWTAGIELPDIIRFFKGDEIEYGRPLEENKLIKDWSTWTFSNHSAALEYLNHIHPKIVSVLQSLAASSKHPLHVLDLGGGSGILAAEIVEKVRNVAKVEVVDSNSILLEEVFDKSSKYASGTLTHRWIDLNDATPLPYPNQCIDVIVLCGVIAKQVLTQEAAVRVLQEAKRLLTPNGYIIVASYSSSLFKGEDYSQMGFRVWNHSYIYENGHPAYKWTMRSFYILS